MPNLVHRNYKSVKIRKNIDQTSRLLGGFCFARKTKPRPLHVGASGRVGTSSFRLVGYMPTAYCTPSEVDEQRVDWLEFVDRGNGEFPVDELLCLFACLNNRCSKIYIFFSYP